MPMLLLMRSSLLHQLGRVQFSGRSLNFARQRSASVGLDTGWEHRSIHEATFRCTAAIHVHREGMQGEGAPLEVAPRSDWCVERYNIFSFV